MTPDDDGAEPFLDELFGRAVDEDGVLGDVLLGGEAPPADDTAGKD